MGMGVGEGGDQREMEDYCVYFGTACIARGTVFVFIHLGNSSILMDS